MGSSFSNQILTLGFDKTFSGGSILKSVLCKTKHAHEQPHTPVTRIFWGSGAESSVRSAFCCCCLWFQDAPEELRHGGGRWLSGGRMWERPYLGTAVQLLGKSAWCQQLVGSALCPSVFRACSSLHHLHIPSPSVKHPKPKPNLTSSVCPFSRG